MAKKGVTDAHVNYLATQEGGKDITKIMTVRLFAL